MCYYLKLCSLMEKNTGIYYQSRKHNFHSITSQMTRTQRQSTCVKLRNGVRQTPLFPEHFRWFSLLALELRVHSLSDTQRDRRTRRPTEVRPGTETGDSAQSSRTALGGRQCRLLRVNCGAKWTAARGGRQR